MHVSALQAYREATPLLHIDRDNEVRYYKPVAVADAAIAELEADLSTAKAVIAAGYKMEQENLERAEQAEAERDLMYEACKLTGWVPETGNPELHVNDIAVKLEQAEAALAEHGRKEFDRGYAAGRQDMQAALEERRTRAAVAERCPDNIADCDACAAEIAFEEEARAGEQP